MGTPPRSRVRLAGRGPRGRHGLHLLYPAGLCPTALPFVSLRPGREWGDPARPCPPHHREQAVGSVIGTVVSPGVAPVATSQGGRLRQVVLGSATQRPRPLRTFFSDPAPAPAPAPRPQPRSLAVTAGDPAWAALVSLAQSGRGAGRLAPRPPAVAAWLWAHRQALIRPREPRFHVGRISGPAAPQRCPAGPTGAPHLPSPGERGLTRPTALRRQTLAAAPPAAGSPSPCLRGSRAGRRALSAPDSAPRASRARGQTTAKRAPADARRPVQALAWAARALPVGGSGRLAQLLGTSGHGRFLGRDSTNRRMPKAQRAADAAPSPPPPRPGSPRPPPCRLPGAAARGAGRRRVAGGSCTKGHTGLPVEPRLPPAPLWVGQVTVRLWLQPLCSLPPAPEPVASSRRMQMSL